MMEAASTSETSVNFYQTTRRDNPEDSRHENLKSYVVFKIRTVSIYLIFNTHKYCSYEDCRRAYAHILSPYKISSILFSNRKAAVLFLVVSVGGSQGAHDV
jgi:hypothetical protein